MTTIRLDHRDSCCAVKVEHGRVVVSRGYGHDPAISGSIHLSPDEADELAKAINEAVDELDGRVAPEHWA